MKLVHVTVVGAIGAALLCTGADARPYHHRYAYTARARHHVYAARAYGHGPYYESSAPYYRNSSEPAPLPYVPPASDVSPGAIIARATIRAQAEPGVTSELAPDARQTATGGPVGGVPGFDGM